MRHLPEQSEGDELLDAFAARAAHALGGGVGVAGGYATLLRERHATDLGHGGKEALSGLEAGLDRIRLFTDDLIELGSMGRRRRLRREPVDTTAVALAAAEGLDADARAIGAQIRVGELPVTTGDAALLERLFHHLLREALSALTDDGGQVEIDGRRRADGIRLEVGDDGPPLDADAAATFFTPFGEPRGTGKLAGAGVGAAISRRIVDRHGGSIWLEPRLQSGCVVVVLLPDRP